MNVTRGSWSWALLATAALVLAPAQPAPASDAGQAAANEVSEASYRYFLGDDQGVEGILYTHDLDDRGWGPEHDLALDNIVAEFESLGLTVVLHPFTYSSSTYYNVVATQLGTVYFNEEYIIGAHFDSVSNPGADDNASGVAAVLEAARVLSQYNSSYTIRYIAFDREEQGLIGSDAYATEHSSDNIRGMISLDMVAYNPGTDLAELFGGTASNPIKNSLAAAVNLYGQGISPTISGALDASDHAPFEWQGFQACLLIEGESGSNPYYHTQYDSVDSPGYIDYDFARRMTRSVVGWLVDQAGVQVPVDALDFAYPNGQPEYVDPLGGTVMRVEVTGLGAEVPQPGTGTLHYDVGSGWQAVPMTEVTPNVYDAVFPAATCGDAVLYYVSAESVGTTVYTDPWDAPTSSFSAIAGYGLLVLFQDDFQDDQGWTAANTSGASSGDWERGVPVDDPGWDYDPASDSDGSGKCYLTQNETGNTDVDGGSVTLTSPIIDMSTGGLTVSYDYFLRLTDSDGTDKLLVEANNNGGVGAWTEVARHDTNGGLSWRSHAITEADLVAASVPPTAAMRFRFTANDGNLQSIVEGGLDAFRLSKFDCAPPADGDYDKDLDVDFYDYSWFQVCFSGDGIAHPAGIGCEVFDFEPDGDVDLTDYADVHALFGGP